MPKISKKVTDYGPFTNPPVITDPNFKLPDGPTHKLISFNKNDIVVAASSENSQSTIRFEAKISSYDRPVDSQLIVYHENELSAKFSVPRSRPTATSEVGVWLMEFDFKSWASKTLPGVIDLKDVGLQKPIKYFRLEALTSLQSYLASKLKNKIFLIGLYGDYSALPNGLKPYESFFKTYLNSMIKWHKGYNPAWLCVVDSESGTPIYETFKQTSKLDKVTDKSYCYMSFAVENKGGQDDFSEYPLDLKLLEDNKATHTFLGVWSVVGGVRATELLFKNRDPVEPTDSEGANPNETITMMMNVAKGGSCSFHIPLTEIETKF